ncbi:MAG TPA: signal peptide peptidase SppA [Vicinamibacterales bacterium]|nr:signal peptide peptidase SppA [Vicinamibacterales bacterium]
MAKRRLFKFFLSLVILFFVVGVLAIVGAWIVVRRGPNVPEHSTLILRIGGDLVETPPNDVLGQVTGGARAQTVRGYVEALRRAKSDPRIESVLIVPTPIQSPFWGKVQEIRDAVLDFRKSGKPINAFLEYAGDREYYLASAADKIYLLPSGSLDVTGVATYEVFLKGTLDKLGARADFEKIGDYKTAPNQLTETTYTPAHREMTESLTRDMYEQLVRGIAESRKKNVEDVRALIDEGPFLAREAQRVGLVDGLAYEDQLDDHGVVSKSGTIEGDRYGRARRGLTARNAPRIAVIYISGIINSGDSGFDPLNGDVAGSTRLVKAIQSARADDNVKAIVVRIDSPGGSSIASDVIWRELTVTKNEKPSRPLVASMSDLAASGGYYVAMAAPHIVAQPATLTGSIGIYGGKFITGGTFDKFGANIESVIIGRNAGLESPDRPFTDSERAKLREQIRDFYNGFIQKVAASRKMPVERVDTLAQGRVWTGSQAREHGLVDALGGLDRAIALAKEKAGISAETEVDIVTYPARRSLAEMLIEELSGNERQLGAELDAVISVVAGLRTAERRAIGLLTAPARLFNSGEPLALMPVGFLR